MRYLLRLLIIVGLFVIPGSRLGIAGPMPLNQSKGTLVHLKLKRGDFPVLRFAAKLADKSAVPKGIVVFGSGCGGWSYFEENISLQLQADGFEVIGVAFDFYAQTDYDLDTLQSDYQVMIKTATSPYGSKAPPIILGGWSTGAEQAVAVAAGPKAPEGIGGLLLVSPGSEGGYGLYATNYFFVMAPSSKVFNLADLAPKLPNIRVAQWHAGFDTLDCEDWLGHTKAPHQIFDFPMAFHDYMGACPAFQKGVSRSAAWIIGEDSVASQP